MNGANEIYNSRNYYGIIACKVTTFIPNHIYNSRNYYGIIAVLLQFRFRFQSTIVEIIMAL